MRCLLFLALLLSFSFAKAQRPFLRDIPLTESGAPVRVNDMVFDATGSLWLGTAQGLLRYNGRTVTEEPANSARRPVSALAAQGNVIFVGFEEGHVLVLYGNKARRLFSAASRITCLLPAPFGLLVGTAGDGIALIRSEGIYRLTTESGLSDDYVNGLALASVSSAPEPETRLVAATDRGITVIRAEAGRLRSTIINTRNTPALGDDIVRVVRWQPGDPAGFVGTQAAGFRLLKIGKEDWTLTSFPSWAGGQINDAVLLPGYQRFIAAEGGLFYQRRTGMNSNDDPVFAGRSVHRILRSATGNVLVATSEGLSFLTAEYLEHIDVGPSYNLRNLSALAADRTGTRWFAQDKALFSFDTGTRARLRYTAPESITSLYADIHDRIWIGTLGGGLLCMKDGQVHTVANVENLRGGHILHIAGRGDTLWVSSLNGVEELYIPSAGTCAQRALRHHGRASGVGSDYIYQLYPDRRGHLWMATDGAGLAMWDGSRYHRWDSSSGFAPRVVYSVVEDELGNIWAGTLENGLLRWDGKTWKTFRREHGLQSNTILSLAALRDGSVVAVNEGGADQWLPESSEFRQYSRRMGLHIDSFSTVLNAMVMDTAGDVLVPYEHGFLIIKPAAQPPDFGPRIALRTVELFFKPVDTTRHRFAPDENGIGFRWEGVHFASPERLHYRYRLRGYGQGWIETGDESVTFPRLPAGRYAFEVEAALGPDFRRAARASYAFQIAAPLWKRWWFWGTVAVALAGIGYALLRRRDHARQRLATLQQARLRAEYEGLKSQVNPHFLFNSLNTLMSLIEEDPTAAARYTGQLADLYRDTLAFRSRDVVALGEEWAVLQKYLYIQQSRFGEALRVETNFTDDVLRDRRIIPLALQLLVENAIKHNEVSRAHPLTISITATAETVTVRNILRLKASPERSTGTGLDNIRNRYALLTPKTISTSRNDGKFTVVLPLL